SNDSPALSASIGMPVLINLVHVVEPTEGIEPTTGGLQNRCSTVELRRHRARFYGLALADRWRTTSKSNSAPAVAAFSDATRPDIGKLTSWSTRLRVAPDTPSPSLPTTTASGPPRS